MRRVILLVLACVLVGSPAFAQLVGQGAGGTSPWRVDFGGSAQPVSQSGSWTFSFTAPQPTTQSGTWTVRLADTSGNGLESLTSAPAGTERGLIVRNIPSGTQAVSGTFWQATQPVSGTFWQATQPVSGTVTANAGTGNFTVVQPTGSNLHIQCDSGCGGAASFSDNGTFTFGTTAVNISAGVLDDVSPNAATENSAAAPRISANRNWYFQLRDGAGNERGASVTAANALKVDGSAVTQPISAASLPLPTGAATLAEQQTQTTALQLIDNLPNTQGSTTSGQSGALALAAVTTAAPSYTTAQTSPLSLTTAGLLRTDGSGVTQPVSGTVTTSPPANASTNVAQLAGTATSVNSGTKDAGTLRVVIATDQPQLTNKLLVTPDSVALPANQSVNAAQIAGTTTVTAGVAGLLAVGGNVANAVAATANPVPVGGIFTTTPTTLTTGQTATLQFTAAQNAKHDLTTIAGTAPSTAGKLDVKAADGDVFVRQATGTNLHAVLDTTSTTAVTQATATNLNAAVVGTGTAGAPAGNILTVQGVASMTKLLVTPDSVALPANQSVNVAQINGVATTMGNGVSGTGVQRVTLASDSTGQVTLATGGNTIGALTANQSVNAAQVNGVATSTGNGVSGTGVQRVAIASDNTAFSVNNTQQGTASQNVAQFGGSAVATGTGVSGTGVPRVTVASDSSLTANIGTTNGLALETTQVTGNTSLSSVVTNTAAIDADLKTGGMSASDTVLLAILRTLVQSGTPRTAAGVKGSFGRLVTSTGDALDVNVKFPAASADPCNSATGKKNIAISQTANAELVPASGGKIYVCALLVVGADAENLSFVEGTGATCATGTAAVIGGTTAANGPNMAANAGWQMGTGQGSVAQTNSAGTALCLFQSGAGRVAGNLMIVIR